jgi:enamine deaminase RidA (YjgF/YER057c/UK114 family)
MAQKEIISPSGLGEPIGPFVRGIRAGNVVAISGTSALSHIKGPLESRTMPDDFESQARLTFDNLETALKAAGLGWNDVIKMMVIIKRREDYAQMNAIRKELFADIPMASTTFVAELLREDMLIEVDVWAVGPQLESGASLHVE